MGRAIDQEQIGRNIEKDFDNVVAFDPLLEAYFEKQNRSTCACGQS